MKIKSLPSITYALLLAVALPAQHDDLEIALEGSTLRVTHGGYGESVALLAGLELREQPLYGGGILRINPLLILAIGKFDAEEKFEYSVDAFQDYVGDPLNVHVQAVSLRDGFFRTSQVVTLALGTKDPEDQAAGIRCGGGLIAPEEVDPEDKKDPRSVEVVDPEDDPIIQPVDSGVAASKS